MKKSEYSVTISEPAKIALKNHLQYIIDNYQNYFAVKSIEKDFYSTVGYIRELGESIPLCEDSKLKELGLRKIHLQKHKLVILFEIHGGHIVIQGIYHTLRNYKDLV